MTKITIAELGQAQGLVEQIARVVEGKRRLREVMDSTPGHRKAAVREMAPHGAGVILWTADRFDISICDTLLATYMSLLEELESGLRLELEAIGIDTDGFDGVLHPVQDPALPDTETEQQELRSAGRALDLSEKDST